MYHVSAQGVDEHMINVYYYVYRAVWFPELFNLPCTVNENNNVHLSCTHQRPEYSHDTY